MYCVPAYQVRAGATPCSPAACNSIKSSTVCDPKIHGNSDQNLTDTSFYKAAKQNALTCQLHVPSGKEYCYAKNTVPGVGPSKPSKFWAFQDAEGSGSGTLYGFDANDTLPTGPGIKFYANPCDGDYWKLCTTDPDFCQNSSLSLGSSSGASVLGVGDFLMPAGDELY